MNFLDKLKKSFEITLLEKPVMPQFGKLDKYPESIVTEYEEDRRNRNESNIRNEKVCS